MVKAEVIATEIIPTVESAGVARLWDRFDDFTKIPRKTGQEQRMTEYVTIWAKSKGLQPEVDQRGNTLILIPATENLQDAPGVILQGHLDMVCVGKPDPATNRVSPKMSEDGEWIEADDTTLGADNGIGVAAVLALAEEKVHGPLALMLTVNEEVGLEGALAMDFKTPLDNFQYLLNFDSEEEGEATISCAGGGDSIISLPVTTETINPRSLQMNIKLEGLMGGHSGLEIHEHRLNAIKSITTVLNKLSSKISGFQLVSINAGVARNVIPSKAELHITIDTTQASQITELLTGLRQKILSGSHNSDEKSLKLSSQPTKTQSQLALSKKSTNKVIRMLNELPDGVMAWSQSVEGLVETSTNLAVVKTESGQIHIEEMTRSSVDADIVDTREGIKSIADQLGATVEQPPSYPGWPANPDSQINTIADEEWKKITGDYLKIIAVHAGLECGAIIGKYPHLEAISIGPTIKGAHSENERVKIDTVTKFYQFAKNIVQKVASL